MTENKQKMPFPNPLPPLQVCTYIIYGWNFRILIFICSVVIFALSLLPFGLNRDLELFLEILFAMANLVDEF
jgi:hypothetical protein